MPEILVHYPCRECGCDEHFEDTSQWTQQDHADALRGKRICPHCKLSREFEAAGFLPTEPETGGG